MASRSPPGRATPQGLIGGFAARLLLALAALLACLSGTASAAQLVLYAGGEFEGKQLNITGSVPDLDDYDFEDTASSFVVVSGLWDLCRRKNFTGKCVRVGPGRYAQMMSGGLENNGLRSVRLVRDDPPPPPPPPPLADLQRDVDARAAYLGEAEGGPAAFRGLSVVVVIINEGKAASGPSTAVVALSDKTGIDPSYVSINRTPCGPDRFPWPDPGGGAATCKKFPAGDIASRTSGATAQCAVPALQPGQAARCLATFGILYNYLAPMPETWIFTAAVDTGKRVKESDERNNGAGLEVRIKGDGLKPP